MPNVFIQYWSMRVMAYAAGLVFAARAVGAVADAAQEARHVPAGSCCVATWAVILPFVMNTAGWLLTESGRQPWIVQGLHADQERRLPVGQRHRAS